MTKPLSKAAQKAADAEAMAGKVKTAIDEARKAAADAFAAYAKTAKRAPQGYILDACGGAYVYVRKPSYAFRKAMKEAGEMEPLSGGRWSIGRFQNVVNDQAITGAEVACDAACEVLRRHFPNEEIHTTSYMS